MRSLFIYLAGLLLSLALNAQFTFNTPLAADYLVSGSHWGGTAPLAGSNANVTIQSGICNINAGDVIQVANLTINSGATLRINGFAILIVTGTFQQNGNFQITAGGAEISLQGDYMGSGQLDLGGTNSKVYIAGANISYVGPVIGNTSSTFIYSRFGPQSILRINYFKLFISGSGVKTLGTGSTVNVNDSLRIDNGATLDFSASVVFFGQHLENNGTLTSATTSFSFFGTAQQHITGNGIFTFNTLFLNKTSGSVHHDSPSLIQVNNQLNFGSGKFILNAGDLELTSSATFNGTFGTNGMIETNVGSLIRSASTVSGLLSPNYPVGVSGTYHPLNIGSASGGGTGGIKIKINNSACSNCVSKYVDLSTTGSMTISDISFRMEFGAGDMVGAKPNKVVRDASVVSNPDTNTVSPPYYFGYNGNLTSAGGFSGSWRFLGGAPIITRIERRSNPGAAASSVCLNEKTVVVGQNFGGITSLTFFGGNISSYTVSATNDSIFIDGFPISGSGNIIVTTADGSANAFLVVMPAPNPATSFTAPSSVCANTGMTIDIPSAEATTTYQAILNGIASSAQVTTVAAGNDSIVVPAFEMMTPGVYSTQLKMTLGGCVDTTITITTTTVFAGPDIVSASLPTSVTRCPSNINFNPTVNNFDAVSWTSSSAGAFSTTVNTVYVPSAADIAFGSVDLTLTASKIGCPDFSRTSTVILIPAPTAALEAGLDTVCAGASATINLYLTGAAPFTGLSLLISSGGNQDLGPISVDTTTVSVTPAAGIPVTYQLTEQASFFMDANGCRGTVSGDHTVATEIPPTSFMSDTVAICQSANATVTLTVTGKFPVDINISNGTDTYTGTANTGSLTINTNPTITGNFTVVSMSTAHCPAGSGTSAGNFRVVVTPNANPATPLTSNSDTLCTGQTVQLGIITEAGVSYVASVAGTDLNAPIMGNGAAMFIPLAHTNPSISTGSNNIIIKATGCATDTLNQSFNLTKSDLPSTFALTAPNGKFLCEATPVVLNASVSAAYMLWRVDGDDIILSNTNTYTALIPGTYQLFVKDNFGCLGQSSTIDVSYGGSKPAVSQNAVSSYETELTASTGTGFAWYAYVNGGLKKIMNATGSVYQAYYDGTYFVSVKQGNCIIFSDTVEVTGKLGGQLSRQNFAMSDSTITIPRLSWEVPVSVYPNPLMGATQVSVRYLNTRGAIITVELYTSDGNLVRTVSTEGQGMIQFNFETFGLKPGLYFMKLDDGIRIVGSNLIIN